MDSFQEFKTAFKNQNTPVIIVSDGEPRVHKTRGGEIVGEVSPGGVAIALEPVAKATKAIYITRGRTEEDKKIVNSQNKIEIKDGEDSYTIKRLFLNEAELDDYYYGFANQTLWPLCHVTFERPEFNREWFEGFKRVNQRFAKAIKEEIKGKTLVWINDYHLSMVPFYLEPQKDVTIGFFWHIPWPTWEVFRILPYKKEIIESLLKSNFIGFHRGYQARNFQTTVERELEARIDDETNRVFYNKHKTVVKNLPLGVDTDVIKKLASEDSQKSTLAKVIKNFFDIKVKDSAQSLEIGDMLGSYKVILGVDRMDYTKGLVLRLKAIDRFFELNKKYLGKVVYIAIMAPSREAIPSYKNLRREFEKEVDRINEKYATKSWQPIYTTYRVIPRKDLIDIYQEADVCLVTPRDDGMNLVSKEFVLASSLTNHPGMLVLSQFAGSAIDLTEALIVNPYDSDEVAKAIKQALEMGKSKKIKRMKSMAETLEERNVYQWAKDFIRNALASSQ